MIVPGPRVHRTAARLFLGVVLTALLTASPGGAAMGGVADDASGHGATMARTDVVIKDTSGDAGNEPHGALYTSFFNSPSVKVCSTPPPCTHQNPVVGSTSYVVVDLTQHGPYGSGHDYGTLKAYYTTSGGGAVWPTDWTLIGSKTVVAADPGVTPVAIQWANVPSLGHFCILVRWESNTDPMNFEGPNTSINTQFNNNIAWKNANTVPAVGGGSVGRPYALANMLAVPAPYDLAFRQVDQVAPGVRVVVDLGPDLFERWARAGRPGEGIRQVGNTQLEVVDPFKGQIRGLLINPGERPVVKLNFIGNGQVLEKPYVLQVVQVGPARELGEKYDVGGVDYTIAPSRG